MAKRVRVAIAAKVFVDWSGGVDFIIYLANAVAKNPDFDVFFLVPASPGHMEIRIENKADLKKYKQNIIRRLAFKKGRGQIAHALSTETAFNDLNDKIQVITYENTEKGFLDTLRGVKADIVLPTTAPYGPMFPLPWIGYIWDFQHKYFPRYFDKNELKARDFIFARTLKEAPAVIVNSKATKKDIAKYMSAYAKAKKIFVLPFAPYPVESWLSVDSEKVIKKYKLKKPYFIVSNQFWIHKSHDTVVKAMAKVVAKNPKVNLICTGKLEEPRAPDHITNIKKLVKKLGLESNIKFLGLIPKADQIALVRGSTALIQPTLYEGGPGGGSAYNAVALGIPVIASDIPVNLEMADEAVTFFRTKSADELSKKMMDSCMTKMPRLSNARLKELGDKRLARLSTVLTESIHFAIDHHHV